MFIADTSKQLACRRDFLKGAACTGAVAAIPRMAYAEEDKIAMWQRGAGEKEGGKGNHLPDTSATQPSFFVRHWHSASSTRARNRVEAPRNGCFRAGAEMGAANLPRGAMWYGNCNVSYE